MKQKAESDAIAKDKQLNEVYSKMSLYEKVVTLCDVLATDCYAC